MDWTKLFIESEYLLRIIVAGACGILIGYERKNRNKEAGVRTHAIVALSAALIMIVSKYGFKDIPDYDASRVAAQIVSGIGFLGAGIIFIRNRTVSGLTTAAGIWATSGIGMAIGAGMYYVGIATAVIMLLTQVVMHRDTFLTREATHDTFTFTILGSIEELQDIWDKFYRESIHIENLKLSKEEEHKIHIEINIVLPPEYDKMQLIRLVSENHNILDTSF